MRIGLSDIDVFAYIDSDSAQAKAFTTYLGYMTALDDLVTAECGELPYQAILEDMDPAGLHRLRSKPFHGRPDSVQSLLINAWLHEMHMHVVDGEAPGIVRIANHAAPVYAYYATSRAASAWLYALTTSAPLSHQALLGAVDRQILSSPAMYPVPWSLRCTALFPVTEYEGFPRPPQPCSNLSRAAPPLDILAMCLRTTRAKRVERLVEDTKKQLKVNRAPNGEKARRDGKLHGTTVFDFLWRSRTRSNYGDPSMFYMGAITDDDVLAYLGALRRITAATCFVFETFLAHRAPAVLTDAATHFISRDRSRLTDKVLVPRLAELGIVTGPKRMHRRPPS